MKRHADTALQDRSHEVQVNIITDNAALRKIADQFQNAK